MNTCDIVGMIRLGEGWMVEFKERLPKPSTLAATLSAFANHQGGTILVGVDDSGRVIGFKPTKEDKNNILRAGRDGCRPSLSNLEMEEFIIDGKSILAIRVPEGASEVYATSDGKYLIREGSENVGIEWSKLHKLISERKKIVFEEQPCEGATFKDIDLEKTRRYMRARAEKFRAQIDIPPEDILKSRKCVLERSGALAPTNAGILLFGKEPQQFLPMTHLTVVKFKGTDHSQGYSDRKDFTGTLVEIVDKTLEWLDDRMYHGGRIPKEGPVRQEVMQFHLPALREILVNAVAHRDYTNTGSRIIVNMFDDRLEIQSPGKLPGHITPRNILREQYARNPSLLLVLMEWGYSEAIGQGLDRVFEELKRLRYRKPKLLDTGASFIFTMTAKDVGKALESKKTDIEHKLNERQERVLAYLKKHQVITVSGYLKINPKVTTRTANRDLRGLAEKGIVTIKGAKRGRHYIISDI